MNDSPDVEKFDIKVELYDKEGLTVLEHKESNLILHGYSKDTFNGIISVKKENTTKVVNVRARLL